MGRRKDRGGGERKEEEDRIGEKRKEGEERKERREEESMVIKIKAGDCAWKWRGKVSRRSVRGAGLKILFHYKILITPIHAMHTLHPLLEKMSL